MKKIKISKSIQVQDGFFDRQEMISWWSQECLKSARVMIVGAGAIGNETLKNLAILGVKHFFIVDFDHISNSNLSRTVLFRKSDIGKGKAETAAKKVLELCLEDDVTVDWYSGDLVWELGTGVFREMSLVLGCVDNIEARRAINYQCRLANTPWIDAGIYELGMRVQTFLPTKAPCYECGMDREQLKKSRERYSCDNFKRSMVSEGKIPTTQITAAIVAGIQAQEAIKLLCGQSVPDGKRIYYQGLHHDFDLISMQSNPNCIAHVSIPTPTSLEISTKQSLRHLLEVVSQNEYSEEGAKLDMRGDREFIASLECISCGSLIKIMRPKFSVFENENICSECKTSKSNSSPQGEARKISYTEYSLNETPAEILNLSLESLGIPLMHIINVVTTTGIEKFYELRGDLSFIFPEFHQKRS